MTTGAPGPSGGPSRGVLRFLRAGAVSSTVLGLAAGAHVVGGGTMPSTFLLSGIVVVLFSVSLLLAGRRFSVPVLAAVLGVGQFALHAAFGLCSGTTPEFSGTGHHQQVVALSAGSGVSSPGSVSSVSMTVAHVLASIVALVLLVHGEALLWRLWTWLRPLVRVLLDVVRFVAPHGFPVCTQVPPRPRSVVARRVRRRGPPRVPALATTF